VEIYSMGEGEMSDVAEEEVEMGDMDYRTGKNNIVTWTVRATPGRTATCPLPHSL
jgi:hypothetical protein